MSTLSVTTINTANGTTDLTLSTGNTSAAKLVISSANGNMGIGNSTPAHSLSINGTAIVSGSATFSNGVIISSGNVNIDTGTLFVDGTNNRVGIANTTPSVTFEVTGTMNVSSNTLNLGTSTAAQNGYTFLPNGLKLNWGRVSAANTAAGTFATFSSAYTSAVYVVQATQRSTARTVPPLIVSSNTTGANISSGLAATSPNGVDFIAIGL